MRILAVGISVRAMIESAVHSSYSVIALDAFGDQDMGALAECHALQRNYGVPYSPHALYEASRGLNYDAVAYTSNLENHPEILEQFGSSRYVIGNSPGVVRSVRNWPDLFSRMKKAGFAVPETIFVDVDRVTELNGRWIVKPVLSGGGRGISFQQGGKFAASRSMLQQYIHGRSCSASFVGNGRKAVLLGVAEQLIGMEEFGAKGFRYCGSILPFPEILDPGMCAAVLHQAREIAEFLVRNYGLRGVNGFDFILDHGKIWLTEVNPRYSASMELIERAYGLPMFRHHVEAAINGRLPEFNLESVVMNEMFFGKSILFCDRNFTAPERLGFPALCLRDIPMPGERLYKGSPVCTILSSRPTYAETFSELIRGAEKLKEQIYA